MTVISIWKYELRAGLVLTDMLFHVTSGPIKTYVPFVEVLAHMREDGKKTFDQKALGTIERCVARLGVAKI